jgi:hypothetical protein
MCPTSFQAESFADWMEQMKPHYAQAHSDFMQSSASLPKEEQMQKMHEWMEAARIRFESSS